VGFQGIEVIALKRAGLLPPIGRRDNRMWATYAKRHTGRKGDKGAWQLIELRNGDVREEAIGLRVAQLLGLLHKAGHRYASVRYASIVMPWGEPERIYYAEV